MALESLMAEAMVHGSKLIKFAKLEACHVPTVMAVPLLITHAQLARMCTKDFIYFRGMPVNRENHENWILQYFRLYGTCICKWNTRRHVERISFAKFLVIKLSTKRILLSFHDCRSNWEIYTFTRRHERSKGWSFKTHLHGSNLWALEWQYLECFGLSIQDYRICGNGNVTSFALWQHTQTLNPRVHVHRVPYLFE